MLSSPSQSIISAVIIIMAGTFCASPTTAQLSFHSDAFKNSYSVQTPSAQQTFTRYYGGSGGGLAAQQAAATVADTESSPNVAATAAAATPPYQILAHQQQQHQQQQLLQLQQQQQQVCFFFRFVLYAANLSATNYINNECGIYGKINIYYGGGGGGGNKGSRL